jgi:hypothetical protein
MLKRELVKIGIGKKKLSLRDRPTLHGIFEVMKASEVLQLNCRQPNCGQAFNFCILEIKEEFDP